MDKEFLWGVSSSAFQVEGAYLEDGKGLTTADIRSFHKPSQADTKVASDQYHHLEEDIELLKELGVKAYRFSISWARILPHGNDQDVNPLGVAYYQKLIQGLKENGIEPVVTLLHFDTPMGLVEDYNGWMSRQSIDDFVYYAQKVFEIFGKDVKYWLTINEQNIMAISENIMGFKMEDESQKAQMLQQANYHLYLANAKAIELCHKMLPGAMIGPAVSYPTLYPATCHPQDVQAAFNAQEMMGFAPVDIYVYGEYPKWYLNDLKRRGIEIKREEEDDDILKSGKPDFLGVNWYCTNAMSHQETEATFMSIGNSHISKNPYLEYSPWGWSIDPEGFYYALRTMYSRYRLPIMVTENGYAGTEELVDGTVYDQERCDYLSGHIDAMLRAIEDGVDMIGYCMWSFIDLLSSSQGFSKRYGLVFVDRTDDDEKECARYKKQSFYLYQKIIKEK